MPQWRVQQSVNENGNIHITTCLRHKPSMVLSSGFIVQLVIQFVNIPWPYYSIGNPWLSPAPKEFGTEFFYTHIIIVHLLAIYNVSAILNKYLHVVQQTLFYSLAKKRIQHIYFVFLKAIEVKFRFFYLLVISNQLSQ